LQRVLRERALAFERGRRLEKHGVAHAVFDRALGITKKSAWFVMHRVRLAMQNSSVIKLGGNGIHTEVDETFIGGKVRNMQRDKRAKLNAIGWGNKTIVVGVFERDGKVRTKTIPNRTSATLSEVSAVGLAILRMHMPGSQTALGTIERNGQRRLCRSGPGCEGVRSSRGEVEPLHFLVLPHTAIRQCSGAT